jgi:hypothetical protein
VDAKVVLLKRREDLGEDERDPQGAPEGDGALDGVAALVPVDVIEEALGLPAAKGCAAVVGKRASSP